jgi:hypothetical protein
MNRTIATITLGLGLAGAVVVTAPAAVAAEVEAVPPSVTPPTCENRERATYAIPYSSGVEYDVQVDSGPIASDVLPGTYVMDTDTVVEVSANSFDEDGNRGVLRTWSLQFDKPTDCETDPRPVARLLGVCKAADFRLRVRDIEPWQVATKDVEFEVTINHRPYTESIQAVGEIQTVSKSFRRKARAKTVRVYVDDALIAKRTYCRG